MSSVLGTSPRRETKDLGEEELRSMSAQERVDRLTPAERAVVDAMAAGLSPKEVAVQRGTSLATVRTQIKKAKKKTASRTLIELVGLVCQARKRGG